MDVQTLREVLGQEIRDLELDNARIEERIAEKQLMLNRLDEFQAVTTADPPPPAPVGVPTRKTITALGPHHYEVGTLTFRNPGEVLDHFGVAHYYSKQNSGKDAASREILRWSKQNPKQAQTVLVVSANGTKMDLHMAVSNI